MLRYVYPPLPAPGTQGQQFGVDVSTVYAFDRAYILSLPPAVQALHAGEVQQELLDTVAGSQIPAVSLDYATRVELAKKLAEEGYFIDISIDMLGGDPYETMVIRIAEGQTQIKNYTGDGFSPPVAQALPPKQATINIAAFPAYVDPNVLQGAMAVIPVSQQPLVGALVFDDKYGVTARAEALLAAGALQVGSTTPQDGGTYKLTNFTVLMGLEHFWVLQPKQATKK